MCVCVCVCVCIPKIILCDFSDRIMGDNQEVGVKSDAEPTRTILQGFTAIQYSPLVEYTTMHEESRAREAVREHAMNQPLYGMTVSPLSMEGGLDVSQVLHKWSGSSSMEEEEEEEVPPLEGDPPTTDPLSSNNNLATKTEEEVKVIGDLYMSYLKNLVDKATIEANHHGDSPPPLLTNQEEEEEEEEEEERLPLLPAAGGSADP